MMAGDLQRLLEHRTTAPVHVVGLSLGAAVALQLALEQPESVRSLVLVNGFSRLRPRSLRLGSLIGRLVLLAVGPMKWLGEWVARDLFPHATQLELRRVAAARIANNDRRSYRVLLCALAGFDVSGELKHIECPTLVIASEGDRILNGPEKVLLAESIPNARLLWLRDSGHAAPIDSPDRINSALLQFLAEVEGDPHE
jgi:pimeloyl-ACP methyl ester carboxylesterase